MLNGFAMSMLFAAMPDVGMVDTKPPDAVALTIRNDLSQTAITIRDADRVSMELWPRAELGLGADAAAVKKGLAYADIPETTLLGVIRFAGEFTDYRRQSIAAGVYTLRLTLQPDIGDHKDTAPHREFALLSPVAKDRDTDTLDVKDLLKLSRAATAKGDHPGVMMLVPVKAMPAKPTIVEDKDGGHALHYAQPVNATGGRTSLAVGLTVKGVSSSR